MPFKKDDAGVADFIHVITFCDKTLCESDLRMNCRRESCLTCFKKTSQSITPRLRASPKKYIASSVALSSAEALSSCLNRGAVPATASSQSTSPSASSLSIASVSSVSFAVSSFTCSSTSFVSSVSFSTICCSLPWPCTSSSPPSLSAASHAPQLHPHLLVHLGCQACWLSARLLANA